MGPFATPTNSLDLPSNDNAAGLSVLEEVERRLCIQALYAAHGRVIVAALALRVSEASLRSRIRRYGLERLMSGTRVGTSPQTISRRRLIAAKKAGLTPVMERDPKSGRLTGVRYIRLDDR